jgi:hypothetical protein
LILKAREKENERLAWELWLSYSEQTKQKLPFKKVLDQFKQNKPVKRDTRTEEEIINDAQNIMKLMKRSS